MSAMPSAVVPGRVTWGRSNLLDYQGAVVPLAGKGLRWTMPAPWVAADERLHIIDFLVSTVALLVSVSIIK
jgi:hypothetical protein